MYLKRTIERHLKESSRHFPIILVTGARQVGKTTVLQKLSARGRTYVTLDDPLLLDLARRDPALFMQRFPPPVLIDEIQYAPGLLPYLKMAVDRDRKPGSFWLTGSQQFHLMQGVSESLAGRVAVIHLLGLSRSEARGRGERTEPFLPLPGPVQRRLRNRDPVRLPELFRLIWRGSFPAPTVNPRMDRDLFFGSYVQTYLQRDVRDLARVGDETAFLNFVRAAAARTAQLLNLAELARDADVAPNTAKNWLSILQASGQVHLLEPFHANLTKRLVKTPKLYFLDSGLAAYLTQWSSPETLAAGAMAGPIFETWVVSELLKSYRHHGLEAPFYFYRDKDRREIDLLIIRDGTVHPLEIKLSATPKSDDVRHFPLLEKLKMKVGAGGVICLSEHFLPLSESANSIPVAGI